MNNKRFFSVNMFRQTFIQLRSVGIIGLIGVLFIQIIQNITNLKNAKDFVKYAGHFDGAFAQFNTISGIDENEFLILLLPLIAVALGLVAWSFLNSRSASDFYHSLPYTRTALFISKFMASVAWILVILTCNMVFQILFYRCNNKYFSIVYKDVFIMHVAMFIYAFQILCAVALACAITGNIFSNILATGMIIFLPRFVTTITFNYFNSCAELKSTDIPGIFANHFNMDVGLVFQYINIDNTTQLNKIVTTGINYVYTLCLCFIFLIFAIIAFNRRNSESAGKGAIGTYTRFAIRVAIAVTINLHVFVVSLGSEIFTRTLNIIFAIFITIIVIGIYEYVSAKRIRAIFRAVPGVIVGILISFVIALLVNASIIANNEYDPSTKDITSICVNFSNQDMDSYNSGINEYTNSIASKIKITDSDVIDMVINAFARSKEKVDDKNRNSSLYQANEVVYTAVKVDFESDWYANKREVWLTDDEVLEVLNCLMQSEEYANAFYYYPDVNNAMFQFNKNGMDLTTKQLNEIYTTAVEDLKKLDVEDLVMARTGTCDYSVTASYSLNGKKYRIIVPITAKYTPNAMQKIVDIINEELDSNSDLRNELASLLEFYGNSEDVFIYRYESYMTFDFNVDGIGYYIDISDYNSSVVVNDQVKLDSYYDFVRNYNRILSDVIDGLKSDDTTNVDANSPYVYVSICKSYSDDSSFDEAYDYVVELKK